MIANIHEHSLNNNKKVYNIGIRILRVILSFMVVVDHIYIKKKKYIYFLYYHIPTFFIISFYFTYKTLISFNINKIKLRFERLIIPYFSWCIISCILCYDYVLLKKRIIYSFKIFFIYIMNGHIFNVVLWFQNILIIINIIFIIIIFLFKKKYLFILNILNAFSYVLLYSGLNFRFFYNNFSYDSASTIGRLAEVFPFALTGFFFASIHIIDNLTKYRKTAIFSCYILLIIITKFKVFAELRNFKYGGFRHNLAGICIFIIFLLFPFTKINNRIITKVIFVLTDYTGGIYFTHFLIGRKLLIVQKILEIKNRTFLGCIITYIISYTICNIGTKFLGKTKFKHLFA